jgi:cell division protein FtsB
MASTRQKTRKVAVALPAMESAPEHWLRNIRVSGFAFMSLGLVVLSIVVLAPSLRTLVAQQQQISALQASVAAQRAQVKHLQSDVARWDDPAYIEAQARERIYYVYPGEYPYIVTGNTATKTDAPTTADDATISSKIQTTQVDWMKSVLSSVFTAGLTDATPDKLPTPTDGSTK